MPKYSTWSFPVLITSCVYIICVTVRFSQFNHISSIELVCVTTLTGDEVKLTMATYGKVKAFNPKSGDWEVYEEQLRFYMVANNITDAAKKRSILLTVCGD